MDHDLARAGGILASAPIAPSPYPPARQAYYVIAVLFLVTVFSQLDRQLPALLVGPIRSEFQISDTAFSLLQGYAFALVYALAGLPLGRLIDHANRRNLILLGMVIWSAMTCMAAFAQTYEQLFLSRVGVGIGEAVLGPAAYSIIADYVPDQRRGRALAAYYMSMAVGAGASLFLGGLIFRLIPAGGMAFPLTGELDSWRWMFILAGAPGLALAFLMLTVAEPPRRDVGGWRNPQAKEGSVREFLSYLNGNRSTFARVLSFPAVVGIIGYAALAWAPAVFERRYGIPPANSGMVIGLLYTLSAVIGIMCCGLLSDRWRARQVPAARLRMTLIGWAIVAPGVLTWPIAGNATASYVLLALTLSGFSFITATAPALIQEITPNRMRGQAIALYLLIGGLVSMGFGPMSVALITDHIFHDDMAVNYALVLVGGPTAALGLWICWSGLTPYAATHRGLDPGAP